MIQNIKELLQNAQLQQKIKASSSLEETSKLIAHVGSENGYSFTQEEVSQVVSELLLEECALTEADLMAVAGGRVPDCKCGLIYCTV